MLYLIVFLLIGINFVPLLLPQLDIWHAQGIFTQVLILIIYSFTFIIQPKFKQQNNIKLGLLHLWVGIQTAFICFIAQVNHKYDITHFFPYFNFLCILIFYRVVTEYLSKIEIEICLLFIKYAIVANLLISVLQYIGCSQFFELLTPNNRFSNNPINGFIGNGTHLSGLLAMVIPVFLYYKQREDMLILALIGLILMLAGTATNDTAINGWIIGGILLTSWIIKIKKLNIYLILSFILFVIIFGIVLNIIYPKLFSFNGRIAVWMYYLPLIKQWFLTGCGLGTMNAIYKESINPNMRHLHMEYIQYLLEIGIIGLVLIVNLIKGVFDTKTNNELEFTFKLIFIGFCISCLFNYPSHLWLPSLYAAFSYAALVVLKRGDTNARIH